MKNICPECKSRLLPHGNNWKCPNCGNRSVSDGVYKLLRIYGIDAHLRMKETVKKRLYI